MLCALWSVFAFGLVRARARTALYCDLIPPSKKKNLRGGRRCKMQHHCLYLHTCFTYDSSFQGSAATFIWDIVESNPSWRMSMMMMKRKRWSLRSVRDEMEYQTNNNFHFISWWGHFENWNRWRRFFLSFSVDQSLIYSTKGPKVGFAKKKRRFEARGSWILLASASASTRKTDFTRSWTHAELILNWKQLH